VETGKTPTQASWVTVVPSPDLMPCLPGPGDAPASSVALLSGGEKDDNVAYKGRVRVRVRVRGRVRVRAATAQPSHFTVGACCSTGRTCWSASHSSVVSLALGFQTCVPSTTLDARGCRTCITLNTTRRLAFMHLSLLPNPISLLKFRASAMTPYVVAVHKTYTTQVTGEVRHGVAPHFTFMFNSFVLIGQTGSAKGQTSSAKGQTAKLKGWPKPVVRRPTGWRRAASRQGPASGARRETGCHGMCVAHHPRVASCPAT
jgi:hypothetical protein